MSYLNGIVGSQVSPSTTEAISTSASSRTEKASSPLTSETSASVGRSDDATVSAAGGLIAQALSGSDVRSERVAALRLSIGAGTYNVPASNVADKLIGSLMS